MLDLNFSDIDALKWAKEANELLDSKLESGEIKTLPNDKRWIFVGRYICKKSKEKNATNGIYSK